MYQITPSYGTSLHKTYVSEYFLVQDLDRRQRASLKSHVRAQDYFGTLATVLSLIQQTTQELSSSATQESLNEILDELEFLQDNYQIVHTRKNKV